jgi:cell fate regulator YaaT (PSP1 superfamily)
MGCSSCSTNSGDTSPGCKNNGTCGTSGCNKLNVYNWLVDMELPEGQKPYNIVEVRFKGSRKEFFRNSEYLELKTGDVVAVEGNPGHDIGAVSLAGELVRMQLKGLGITDDSDQIKSLYRLAKPADIEKWNAVKALEVETMYKARSIALKLNLKMKLSDVEFQGDGKKATFYYTADERVDFRELIKKLADEFRTRVEMRQIGMRQEASRLGGIGSCGRELCCSTWLTDFKIVSTSAARYQNLSLNPTKLAGQCGKLKCCLNYELDSYMEAIRDIPDANSRLETLKGVAMHRKTDIFKKMMWFVYTEEGGGGSNSDNWIPLHVDRVKEIIFLNKQGEKPADLKDYADLEPVEKKMDYADVVGQDSLNRMLDKKKKKKKKKKGGQGREDSGATAVQTQRPQQNPRPATPNADNRNSGRQENRQDSNQRPASEKQQLPQPKSPLVPQQQKIQQSPQQSQSNSDTNRPARTPIRPSENVPPAPPKVSPPPAPTQQPSSTEPSTGRVRQIPPRVKPPDQ